MPPPRQLRQSITFDDLPLQQAIAELFNEQDFVRSELLLIAEEDREWILQQVIFKLPHDMIGKYRFEHILLSVNQFRKMDKVSRAKRLLVIQHSRKMQKAECFYRGKLATECTNEVDLDRIKPGRRGGAYTIENTVLSCSRHNRSRGSKEVAMFWRQ